MSKVNVNNLNRTFKNGIKSLEVLKNIQFYLRENEFVSIIGPSGCGKSTIFRILSGIDKDYSGEVLINNTDITKHPQKVAYLQQRDMFMPWRTVIENIILPLEITGEVSIRELRIIRKHIKANKNYFEAKSVSEPLNSVFRLINDFGLNGFEDYMPYELSGGMRQRAALLRSFIINSDIMLLDEPFAALDAITKTKMQDWLLKIWNTHKKSVLFITHDIDEAIYMSDRIYVLSERPATIKDVINISFRRPRNRDMLMTQEFNEYKGRLFEVLLGRC